MPPKRKMIRLPSPSNINPPIKGINNLKKRICSELVKSGRFGARKQVIDVMSVSGYYCNYRHFDAPPSEWMAELLNNPRAIRFLREQLNRDFISQGWHVTWLEPKKCGYVVKMNFKD